MVERMIADGVAAGDYFPDYFRMLQGIGAGNKKSYLYRILVQQFQYLSCCRLGRTIIKSQRDIFWPVLPRLITGRKKLLRGKKKQLRKGQYKKRRLPPPIEN